MSNVTLGVWLFLASEVMLFGGLFSAYFMLRAGAAAWGEAAGHLGFASANTIVLLLAGAALAAALTRARRGDPRAFRICVGVALLLALAFLGVKGLEYADDLRHGWYPRTSTRWAVYYLLTGIHALHVVGGMLVNARLALTSASPWSPRDAVRIAARTHAALLYWYFVDVIWIILVVLLYVV